MLVSTVFSLALARLQGVSTATPSSTQLSQFALQKVLTDAAPIFGDYQNASASTATWMQQYPDDTLIVHMNIPGTHDSQTWNYSLATQQALAGEVAINGEPIFPPEFFHCQENSLVDMLNDGIRVFDMRFAFDPTNTTLVFYHSQAIQSETATLEDVLFGFYQWLDDHPSEAVFLSLMYEGSTAIHASDNAAVQTELFRTLTTPAALVYFNQVKDDLGSLGQARGKITLLKRFDLDMLPAASSAALPGVHFSPANWTDNSPDFSLIYNPSNGSTAFIEDFYNIDAPTGSGAALNIQWKYNATTAALTRAATAQGQQADSLFWSFCSSEHVIDIPSETPQIMALGNGTATPGVNQLLVPFFKNMTGKRLGIAMFDFYDQPADLIQSFLAIQTPGS